MDNAFTLTIDFDEWSKLSQSDAEAFERRRREVIDSIIAESPEHMRERLRRLQWRVDAARRRYKHPLKSCVVIFNMMWDSVYGEHGLLDALNGLTHADAQPARGKADIPARILPLRV